MQITEHVKSITGFTLAIMLLVACHASTEAPATALPTAASFKSSYASPQRSWIRPGVASGDLLYVTSPNNNAIYILRYPHLDLVGLIGEPKWVQSIFGLCSDTKGNVFVPLLYQQQVLEFAHGGIKPIATLNVSNATPFSCAYDSTTGDLAVTLLSASGGGVAIFSHETGTPQIYDDAYVEDQLWSTYDDHGNLFVDGVGNGTDFALSELPNGGKSFVDISVNQTLDYSGSIQWHRKHVTVFAALEQGGSAIYRLKISGLAATVVGTTPLNGTGGYWAEILGNRLIIADQGSNAVKIFGWPTGGDFIKSKTVYQASAIAISAVGKH